MPRSNNSTPDKSGASNVVPFKTIKRTNKPDNIDEAMSVLRRIAHRNDLVVEGPCRLRGMSLTGFGKSNNPVYEERTYDLGDPDKPFAGASITPEETVDLAGVAKALLTRKEWSLTAAGGTNKPPTIAELAEVEAEGLKGVTTEELTAEWTAQRAGLWNMTTDNRVVGAVLRLGEDKSKRYLVFLRGPNGRYEKVIGQPMFDYPLICGKTQHGEPLFGMRELIKNGRSPVMVHEGPKSAQAAASIAAFGALLVSEDPIQQEAALAALRSRGVPVEMARWLSIYEHVGVQGAEAGLSFVDFSPLRGREHVLFWSDIDEKGIAFSTAASKMLAALGNVASYVTWEQSLILANRGWDMADAWVDKENPAKNMTWLTRTEVRKRTRYVESPLNNRGRLLEEWVNRSFIDKDEGQVYTRGRFYLPMKEKAIRDEYGKNAWATICRSSIQPYRGSVFRPGIPMGLTADGRLNVCPPHMRAGVLPAPLPPHLRWVLLRWLTRMIPSKEERWYAIRRAALVLAAPQHVPRSMVFFHGPGGTGKSVFMTILKIVNGDDRSSVLAPDDVVGSFNEKLQFKSFIGVHEIHGSELNRSRLTNKFKELVANEEITIHRKGKDRVSMPNVIHWFAASNEAAPVEIKVGTDRFNFISCPGVDKTWMEKWANKWVPRLYSDPVIHEHLYAAALWLIARDKDLIPALTARAKAQPVWKEVNRASWNAWQQITAEIVEQFTDPYVEEKQRATFIPPTHFFGEDVVRLVRREFTSVNPENVRRFMKSDLGVKPLVQRRKDLPPVDRRIRTTEGRQETLWCREKDYDRLIVGPLPARTFKFDGDAIGSRSGGTES
jgi:hypothetical protein